MFNRFIVLAAVAMLATSACSKKKDANPNAPGGKTPPAAAAPKAGGTTASPAKKVNPPHIPVPAPKKAEVTELEGWWLADCEVGDFGAEYPASRRVSYVNKDVLVEYILYYNDDACTELDWLAAAKQLWVGGSVYFMEIIPQENGPQHLNLYSEELDYTFYDVYYKNGNELTFGDYTNTDESGRPVATSTRIFKK